MTCVMCLVICHSDVVFDMCCHRTRFVVIIIILLCTVDREVKLSPPDVEHRFQLLARYTGSDVDRHILKEISWMDRE